MTVDICVELHERKTKLCIIQPLTARQSAKLHGNPISCAKIACKIRVGHVGCLNLRVESTFTMALFLYHCTHSLGRKISITFVYCR